MIKNILALIMTSLMLVSIFTVISVSASAGDTEYWAVIVGVDVYAPEGDSLLPFDEHAEFFKDLLLVSSHWKSSNIKILTNKEASFGNIMAAFNWLAYNEDDDDICLIFYTAHGSQLGYDLAPKDEEDGKDEFLTTSNPLAVITDDTFNAYLDKLDSKGVAVIINACHSGGMIDSGQQNMPSEITASEWISEFSGELNRDGRVMMSCCEESEVGLGLGFAEHIMNGLQGYADDPSIDDDAEGMISAEEAYDYARRRYISETYDNCHPVIDDQYDGRLLLTCADLPPNIPSIDGPTIIKVEEKHDYTASTVDPDDQGDGIIYGWDWNAECPEFSEDWLSTVDEWDDNDGKYYASGETCFNSHFWEKPGIFDVRVKACDNLGAQKIPKVWSSSIPTIVCSKSETVDQFQIIDNSASAIFLAEGETIYNDLSVAQSFKSDSNKLAKIKIKGEYLLHSRNSFTISLKIHEELTEEPIIEMSKTIKTNKEIEITRTWIEFTPDEALELESGSTYYLVLTVDDYQGSDNLVLSWRSSRGNNYNNGKAYIYNDYDQKWDEEGRFNDYCFVIYGHSMPEDNYPPDKPNRPSGSSSSKPGIEYTYCTSALDPDGDQIWYMWDWDDGTNSDWIGPYNSGDTCEATHTWTSQGTYQIKVKAKDEHGAESEWSDPLSVTLLVIYEPEKLTAKIKASRRTITQTNHWVTFDARESLPETGAKKPIWIRWDYDGGGWDTGWRLFIFHKTKKRNMNYLFNNNDDDNNNNPVVTANSGPAGADSSQIAKKYYFARVQIKNIFGEISTASKQMCIDYTSDDDSNNDNSDSLEETIVEEQLETTDEQTNTNENKNTLVETIITTPTEPITPTLVTPDLVTPINHVDPVDPVDLIDPVYSTSTPVNPEEPEPTAPTSSSTSSSIESNVIVDRSSTATSSSETIVSKQSSSTSSSSLTSSSGSISDLTNPSISSISPDVSSTRSILPDLIR